MFTKFAAAMAGAWLAGSAVASPVAASPVAVRANDILKRTPSPMSFKCAKEWKDDTLFAGTCPSLVDLDANAAVNVDLGIALPKAAINGDISIGLTDNFLIDPTLSIDVSGLEVYIEVDISASAAVQESVELMASGKLSLDVPELLHVGLDAALALDLIVSVSAAIDVEAGFYLTFPENSVIEVSLLTKEIVGGSLGGAITNVLPLGLGLDVGAGLEAAVFINLFDCTSVIVATSQCPLSISETLVVEVGISVELDIDVADVLDISLAPAVLIEIAAAPAVTLCLPTIPNCSRCGGGAAPTTSAIASPTAIGLVPTTIFTTSTYTVTQCAVTVPNCPASHIQKVITSTIKSTVTYCPASETASSLPAATTSVTPTSVQVPVPTVTRSVTITECPAKTKTYTVPTDVSTPAPTVVVPDAPESTPPTVIAQPSPETPVVTASSSLPAVASVSVPAASSAPTSCVGCVGPVTGVPSQPQPTTSTYLPPQVSSSSTPVPTSTITPPPVSAGSRVSTGAFGAVVGLGVAFALL